MVYEALLALLLAAAAVLLLRFVFFRLRTGMRGEGVRTVTVVYAKDGAAVLQETVLGLIWLVDSGRLSTEIVIADAGMDSETRRAAELLAARDERLRLIKAAQVVDTWQTMENTGS